MEKWGGGRGWEGERWGWVPRGAMMRSKEHRRKTSFGGKIACSFLEILISTGKESRPTVPKSVGNVAFKFN